MPQNFETPESHWLEFSLQVIKKCFLESISEAYDIVNILEILLWKLVHQISEVPSDEFDFFSQFMSGLRECIEYRKNSFDIMDLSTHFITTMEYILVWLMHQGYPIDAYIISRRKSLVSDLEKIMKKSIRYSQHLSLNPCQEFLYPTDIFDRFGSTLLVNNQEDSDTLIYLIYEVGIKGVLCGESFGTRSDFIQWLSGNSYINPISKSLVLSFLQTLKVRRLNEKPTDYIASPKDNGYEALQDVLIAENASMSLKTFYLDLHITDSRKNDHATFGAGNHSDYKEDWFKSDPSLKDLSPLLSSLFEIPAGTPTNIPGFIPNFNRPKHLHDRDSVMLMVDSDGIQSPSQYARRHLSPQLCKVPLQYKTA